MTSLFVHIVILCRSLAHDFRDDAEFRALAVLLIILLMGGTLFYWQVQNWSILDSIYFCVMSISTIGYGDFVPTTPVSKAFTIVFVISGIGLFASFVGKLVALRMNNYAQRKKKA